MSHEMEILSSPAGGSSTAVAPMGLPLPRDTEKRFEQEITEETEKGAGTISVVSVSSCSKPGLPLPLVPIKCWRGDAGGSGVH